MVCSNTLAQCTQCMFFVVPVGGAGGGVDMGWMINPPPFPDLSECLAVGDSWLPTVSAPPQGK